MHFPATRIVLRNKFKILFSEKFDIHILATQLYSTKLSIYFVVYAIVYQSMSHYCSQSLRRNTSMHFREASFMLPAHPE